MTPDVTMTKIRRSNCQQYQYLIARVKYRINATKILLDEKEYRIDAITTLLEGNKLAKMRG